MRQPGENRMASLVDRAVTSPEWDVETNRVVYVRRDFTRREAFVATGRRLPSDVRTVVEVIEGGLTDVRVACPWDVHVGATRVATVAQVLTWAQAVEYGVLGAGDE